MSQSLARIALLVEDYDEAIQYYTEKLGFQLIEDTPLPEGGKRWVIVAPAKGNGAEIVVDKATTPEQVACIGHQAGGKVFLFLTTDSFWEDYARMTANGVEIVRQPLETDYGTVAIFQDLYGNKWDFIQYKC